MLVRIFGRRKQNVREFKKEIDRDKYIETKIVWSIKHESYDSVIVLSL